jgi:uncharacterized protein YneF (UPF0154 family)
MDFLNLVAGALLFILAGFFIGMFYNIRVIGQIKSENERLNRELHKLTDRDERGRFKGGK